MAFEPTNPVVVGNATKKDHYDTVFNNTVDLNTRLAAIEAALPLVCNGRLTLSTGVPLPTSDVTAATAVKFTPFNGNRIALYDGTDWAEYTFSELSIAVPATTGSIYDVFAYVNAGAAALELSAAWVSDVAIFGSGTYQTTRPTQDGVEVKSTNGTTVDATRRYLGSFRTTSVSGQTEDSIAKRWLFNRYNQRPRVVRFLEPANSYTYTTATYRQMNANPANQFDILCGLPGALLSVEVIHASVGSAVDYQASIGEDSTSTPLSGVLMGSSNASVGLGVQVARLHHYPALGRHYYPALEISTASGTTTWYGDQNQPTRVQSGGSGIFEC